MFHIPPFFLLKTFDRPKNIANPLCGLLKILFALFCAFTICGCLALAEERLGFQLSENERIMAYHNGGEILCSVFDEQMQLTAVRKLDSSNRTLWAYNFSEPYINGTLLFCTQENGTRYSFCGKKQKSEEYEAIRIDGEGQIQQTMTFPSGGTPRALTDAGILLLFPYEESKNQQMIEHWGWDERHCRIAFDGKLIEVQQTKSFGENIYLSVIHDQPHMQRQMAILILNLETGRISRYDIGPDTNFFVQAMGKSLDNGVIAVIFDQAQACQRIIHLTSFGEPVWQTALSTNLYGPFAQIIKQSEQGGYVIWGTAAIREDKNTYPQEYTTYRIDLGQNGELIDDAVGIYSGTCVVYKAGQVYVANTDELPYVSLDMFKESFRVQKPIFYMHTEK